MMSLARPTAAIAMNVPRATSATRSGEMSSVQSFIFDSPSGWLRLEVESTSIPLEIYIPNYKRVAFIAKQKIR